MAAVMAQIKPVAYLSRWLICCLFLHNKLNLITYLSRYLCILSQLGIYIFVGMYVRIHQTPYVCACLMPAYKPTSAAGR